MATTQEKRRTTEIKRVYDDTGKYWVDVEVLTNASFDGRQWEGPDKGNTRQETILSLKQKLSKDGSSGDVLSLGLNPDNPLIGQPRGGVHGPRIEVKVPARVVASLEARNNVDRQFDNTTRAKDANTLSACGQMKQRISFNDIADRFLTQGGDDQGKQPPTKPKDYKKAVSDTDDGANLWVDICIPKDPPFSRARGFWQQTIKFQNIWQGGKVDLPGAADNTSKNGPHFKLDLYQVPINFGPDTLAVEFHDGAGPANNTK